MIIWVDHSRLGSFPQVSRQVKKWPILQLHKTIRVSHAVECPVVFILLYDRDGQGGVFKIMKNDHFLEFFPFCSFSLNFWAGEGVVYIRIA